MGHELGKCEVSTQVAQGAAKRTKKMLDTKAAVLGGGTLERVTSQWRGDTTLLGGEVTERSLHHGLLQLLCHLRSHFVKVVKEATFCPTGGFGRTLNLRYSGDCQGETNEFQATL